MQSQQENAPMDRKIAEDVDSAGNAINIWFCQQLGGSRCMPLMLRTFAEIMEKGLSREYVTWGEGNRYKAVYCTESDDSRVIGGIAFEYFPVRREGWIILSFTDPASRGRRINQVLHKYFENTVQQMGGTKIGSHVSINNSARLRAAERVGFKPAFFRMEKELVPVEDATHNKT